MIELKVINKIDPLKRNAEKHADMDEYSPMNPPEAYDPPNIEEVPYEDMHPFLQQLCDEHKACVEKIDKFESTLMTIQESGFSKEILSGIRDFFDFFDNNIVSHNQKEEKTLFPLLDERLKTQGEHGNGRDGLTSVDMMEDDHVKALQLAAVIFNFFGVSMKLPDPDSRLIVLDMAIEQGKVLIELLKLHIFREDHIVFAQAHQHITKAEFDKFLKEVQE